MFVSHAQNFEDVILWRALKHVANGFYIDIGANDPAIDSVSLAFYERGWRGVNVEPLKTFADELRRKRPDEVVLQTAIGVPAGQSDTVMFHNVGNGGLSTGLAEIAEAHAASGFVVQAETVPCMPLSALLDQYGDREVHWLKIDVEGMENVVLSTRCPSTVRPWIVVVESTLPTQSVNVSGAWEPIILGLGYTRVYFDGLNTFYLHRDHVHLKQHFTHGPCVFDQFTLSGTSSSGFTKALNTRIDALTAESARMSRRLAKLEQFAVTVSAVLPTLSQAAAALGEE